MKSNRSARASRLRAAARSRAILESLLEERRLRVYAATFIVRIMAVISTYGLALSALWMTGEAHRPSPAIQSALLIPAACTPIALMIRGSGYPAKAFGLTLRDWPRIVREAVLYSLPVLAALVALKWVWIRVDSRVSHLEGRPFEPRALILAASVYTLLCPMQEFIARSALQSSLRMFIPADDARARWIAIVVANMFFAAAHTHLGLVYSVATFIPGLFWGWLYDKQRSLVGVTVSHALIGCVAIFGLGLDRLLTP